MFLPSEIQWEILKKTLYPGETFDAKQFFKLYRLFPKTLAYYGVFDLKYEFKNDANFHKEIKTYLSEYTTNHILDTTCYFFQDFYMVLNWGECIHHFMLHEKDLHDYKPLIHWKRLLMIQTLPDGFILENIEAIKPEWTTFQIYQDLNLILLIILKDYLDWDLISRYQDLTFEKLNMFQDKLNWYEVSNRETLCAQSLVSFRNVLYWTDLCQNQNVLDILDDSQIDACSDYIEWLSLIMFHGESIQTRHIVKYFKQFEFRTILQYAILESSLLETLLPPDMTELDWNLISNFQNLSEWFIEKYIDFLNISIICEVQDLSMTFIDKYYYLLDWPLLCQNQHIYNWSTQFIDKHRHQIYWSHFFDNPSLKVSKEFLVFKNLYCPITFD